MTEAVASGCLVGSWNPCLSLTVTAPEWISGAVCAWEQDLFFPEDYSLRNRDQIEEARSRCLACPALVACGEWAIPQARLDGIWGAMTPPERRRIRRQRLRAA